ncbi:AAA family ATPase [Spirosoma luteum]|uniref:AAA family ATPase n=1 Tax=Spirosoma luteum TaxID=431553 RepID=UPI00037824F7|nr:AAA family ATPase [Spirosoma luteum]
MKIKSLVIENFKSIERIELIEPNPFTVFVGPNGSGKSNIFEALEFVNLRYRTSKVIVTSLFGGYANFLRRQDPTKTFAFNVYFDHFGVQYSYSEEEFQEEYGGLIIEEENNLTTQEKESPEYKQYFANSSRLFVKNEDLVKLPLDDNRRLSLSAKNLEKVLKRLLNNKVLKAEIFEWLELFVPGFKAVEVDERDELHWFENSTPQYFTKDLISDGTKNILALLTAIYQSQEPQFLCIEEPENGLNPKVVKELVNLCRYACEEFGHYIWLNTHSHMLVSQLTSEEIVLVDKKEGVTKTKQIQGMDLHDLPMDEAWLSNALGGGIPW